MSAPNADEFAPILEGAGASDYERYLRTDELLALQKGPDEWVHRDELLFQTVHQSSELFLKHAWTEVEEATRLIEARDAAGALRLLGRANHAIRYVVSFLEHLELMSPWEYQEVRRVLGHGSGFDSPGFRMIRQVSPDLYAAFDGLRRERGLSLLEVYTRGRENEDLYQLAEALIDWDEQVGVWRFRHVKMVGRVIGEDVVGTQGTPVELLAGLIKHKMFPELWTVRTELTELAKQSDYDLPRRDPPGPRADRRRRPPHAARAAGDGRSDPVEARVPAADRLLQAPRRAVGGARGSIAAVMSCCSSGRAGCSPAEARGGARMNQARRLPELLAPAVLVLATRSSASWSRAISRRTSSTR